MTPTQSVLGRIAAGAALSVGVALSGSALAQAPNCKAELAKFCPQAKPGGGQIAACLKENAAQLSPGCKERIAQVRQSLKEVHQACEDDIHALCPGTKPGGGRIAACLRKHEAQVSADCRARLAAAKAGK